MPYLVDAWLERREPVVRLVDADSCATLAEWRGDAVRKLFSDGILELDCLLESLLLFLGAGKTPLKNFS